MYGAILGDIISLRHKRDESGVCYLVEPKIKFTDYTVSMIALADALTSIGDDEDHLEEKIRQSLIRWGKAYWNANYSVHFKKWLANPSPIDDYDNDNTAAARAVIIPYLYNDRDRIYETAELSAVITHGDVDNYKWSILVALAVYYGMRSSGKNGAKNNFEHEIGCEMSKAISYETVVVEAMDAFLNSTDVRSAIQNAIARGGDISARAIIAGSIAEGFYGMSYSEKEMCNRLLPESMLEVLDKFDKVSRRNFIKCADTEEDLTDELIENAIRQFNKNDSDENRKRLMDQIYYGMRAGGNLRIPLVVPDRQKVFDEGKLTDDVEYLTHQTANGKTYVAAYTSDSPEMCEKYPDIYLGSIESVFSEMVGDDVEESGIILNPDDKDLTFTLDKDDIKKFLNRIPPENKMFFFDGSIEELNTNAIVSSDFEDFKYLSFENSDDVTVAHFMIENPSRTIYTPLMFYDGDDEDVILNCYYSCLNLAQKYHLASVAFPDYFISPFLNKAVKLWFDANKDYGMTVIVASGKSEDINEGKERHFFAFHFIDEELSNVQRDEKTVTDSDFVDKAKSEAYRNLVERAKKQYPEYRDKIKPTEADKQRTRDFAATFNSKQDFWEALRSKGLKWTITTKDNTTDMWARNALSKAIACGFDPNTEVNLFASTINGVNICNEINLYTYWQGFGYAKKTPKIKYLLVAQDWGNFIDAPDEFKSTVVKMNADEKIFPAVGTDPTSVNLVKLFKILDRDVTKPCVDVFFTNFCLGYRFGKETGGMTKELMMRDADLFRELCEILEPENILCLGRITSECVYETLTGEPFKKVFGDSKNYNDFLDNHPQIVIYYGAQGQFMSNFYPLAHCGFLGTQNRNRDYDLPEIKADILFKQRQDWQKIIK